jgi:hypothetical protein
MHLQQQQQQPMLVSFSRRRRQCNSLLLLHLAIFFALSDPGAKLVFSRKFPVE